jgi:hypothetical protein
VKSGIITYGAKAFALLMTVPVVLAVLVAPAHAAAGDKVLARNAYNVAGSVNNDRCAGGVERRFIDPNPGGPDDYGIELWATGRRACTAAGRALVLSPGQSRPVWLGWRSVTAPANQGERSVRWSYNNVYLCRMQVRVYRADGSIYTLNSTLETEAANCAKAPGDS